MKKNNIFIFIIILFFTACHVEKRADMIKNKSFQKKENSLTKKPIICIDPGHAITNEKKKEKISPKSDILKDAYVSGTKGEFITEEQLNLILALKLKQELEKMNFQVVMTRTISEITISNIDRANFANNSGAVLCIHIHADWSTNSKTHGISVLVPSGNLLINENIIEESKKLGISLLNSTILATEAKNNGLSFREDLTGFNWSNIPTVFIETGFMSNKEEDALLNNSDYQSKIVKGMASGINNYILNKN